MVDILIFLLVSRELQTDIPEEINGLTFLFLALSEPGITRLDSYGQG